MFPPSSPSSSPSSFFSRQVNLKLFLRAHTRTTQNNSYRVLSVLKEVRAFVEDPEHAKEIIVIDFQDVRLDKGYLYDENPTATGVLIRMVWDQLGPYILPFDDPGYYTMGPGALTLGQIWATNAARGAQRQIIVLFPRDRLNDRQGCGEPYPSNQIGQPRYFAPRDEFLLSLYGEHEATDGIKRDVDAQLSRGYAEIQGGADRVRDYFDRYRNFQQNNNLRVLQMIPRPSNTWYATTGFFGYESLLNYGLKVDNSLNDCPGPERTSGWLGQRMWASLVGSTSFQGPWNRPNILMIDNYAEVVTSTTSQIPRRPVNWRAMAWGGGTWKQTNADFVPYVDYVKSLNLLQPLSADPGIQWMSPNDNCYSY